MVSRSRFVCFDVENHGDGKLSHFKVCPQRVLRPVPEPSQTQNLSADHWIRAVWLEHGKWFLGFQSPKTRQNDRIVAATLINRIGSCPGVQVARMLDDVFKRIALGLVVNPSASVEETLVWMASLWRHYGVMSVLGYRMAVSSTSEDVA
jgi:hypothetical protein